MGIPEGKRLKELERENTDFKMTALRLPQGSASLQHGGLFFKTSEDYRYEVSCGGQGSLRLGGGKKRQVEVLFSIGSI